MTDIVVKDIRKKNARPDDESIKAVEKRHIVLVFQGDQILNFPCVISSNQSSNIMLKLN